MTCRERQQNPQATFLRNAENIFEAAQGAFERGETVSELDILIGSDGGVHLKMNGDGWGLEALQAHHGARMAYRVRQLDDRVRLEGRAGSRTCLFEAAKPDGAARLLLANTKLYDMGLNDIGPDRMSLPAAIPAAKSIVGRYGYEVP
ncbi:MAG: hypothetical protein U0Q16_37055 [Bryobacteraceae bacterium]